MRIVVALGGNALLRRGEPAEAATQLTRVRDAASALARLVRGHELVVTHGNGPQVGLLALEAEAYTAVRPYPLDVLGAESQGMIGYLLAQALSSALPGREVAALLTQVVVDPGDPAFRRPTKPIGPVYGPADARRLEAERGWTIAPDGGGFRRVVASPRPCAVVELPTIVRLVDSGAVVVCAGGGGVPVVRVGDGMAGVEAVIDKDSTAALLAIELAADRLVMLTDVPYVERDRGTPGAVPIERATPEELRALVFAPGRWRRRSKRRAASPSRAAGRRSGRSRTSSTSSRDAPGRRCSRPPSQPPRRSARSVDSRAAAGGRTRCRPSPAVLRLLRKEEVIALVEPRVGSGDMRAHALLRAARRGDGAARARLVEQHLVVIRALAARYRDFGLPLDDLVQEGSIGLLDAIDHYDPARGGPFEPYARFRVRRAIRNALTEQGRLIRLPKQIVERRRAVERAESRLLATGTRPTPPAIAAATGLSLEAVLEARSAPTTSLSLDAPISPDGTSLESVVADPSAADPAQATVEHDEVERLERALAHLPERQRRILRAQWGLNGRPAASAAEIARALALSPRRTQTLAQDALYALRDELEPVEPRA